MTPKQWEAMRYMVTDYTAAHMYATEEEATEKLNHLDDGAHVFAITVAQLPTKHVDKTYKVRVIDD